MSEAKRQPEQTAETACSSTMRGQAVAATFKPDCFGALPSDACGLYRTILIDPPWPQGRVGRFARHSRPDDLPYQTMTVRQIRALPVAELAADGCHLWLWTTNQFLPHGFSLLKAWGFKYLAPITWSKPSGLGAWFVHRTQTLLMGYKNRCVFNRERYRPTVLPESSPRRHSEKPESSYELIEAISDEPRLELFARPWSPLFPKRAGWHVWGNEVASDLALSASVSGQTENTARGERNPRSIAGKPA